MIAGSHFFPQRGVRYRVWYRIPGVHRKDRTLEGVFIGETGEVLSFDLRPEHGTTALNRDWIGQAEVMG